MTAAGIICMAAGASFVAVAALGVLRMPDLYTRMHAATKAGTLGSGLLLVGAALMLQEPWVTIRALLTVAFIALTAPVASHLVARAAYRSRLVELWQGPDSSKRHTPDGLSPDSER